jgi:hypothetical protein
LTLRLNRDPNVCKALLREAVQSMLDSDLDTSHFRAVVQDRRFSSNLQ